MSKGGCVIVGYEIAGSPSAMVVFFMHTDYMVNAVVNADVQRRWLNAGAGGGGVGGGEGKGCGRWRMVGCVV